jgi:hypothetical protein
MEEKNGEPTQAAESEDGRRRREYRPPGIEWEEEMASRIAACGKIGGSGGQCNVVPGAS